jgi:hypothetical protein
MARIESRLPPDSAPDGGAPRVRGLHGMNERNVIIAAGTGLIAFGGTKYGVLKQIPGLGPVPAAAVTIALGIVLSSVIERPGTLGAVLTGVGYGLVAVGALELAGA